MIVPALGLGVLIVLLVLFFVGTAVIYVPLRLIASRRNYLTERTEDMILKASYVGGGLGVVLVFILLFTVLREWATEVVGEWGTGILIGLTIIGILVGLSTFVLSRSRPNSKAETNYGPTDTHTRAETEYRPTDNRTRQESKREHQRHDARVYDLPRDNYSFVRERREDKSEYETRTSERQRKQAEIEAIKDDLYSLIGISDDRSQKQGKRLEGVLNRFFKANDIPVREAFELVQQDGEGAIECTDGVIEIDGGLYLVGIKWRKEPLGIQEVSPFLVRLFNRGHTGGILISYSEVTQPAIATCKEALSQKIVVLCEMQEIIILLEQNGSLIDFLKAKITAAAVDKNPLFKPLSSQH